MRTSVVATILLSAAFFGSCSKQKQQATPAAKSAQASDAVSLSSAEQQQVGIETSEVQLRSVPLVLHVTGRLALNENRTWRVGAVTEGRVISVLANPGDTVSAGQVLARMHSHEIHDSRAMYQKAVSDLSSARQQEAYALKIRDRDKRLYAMKAASLAEVESAETALKVAQTASANAEAEVERTRRHITEFLDVALEDRGNEVGDLVPVKAPSNAVVLSRNVTPGTVLEPSAEAFVLSDLRSLWMIASVSEEHLPKLRVGMPVEVYVRAYGDKPFAAKIQHIGEVLDPTTRTVTVRIEVPNAGNELKPEMYATGDIELGGSSRSIFIPEGAQQEINGQKSVFVQTRPGRFEVRPIETGRTIEGALLVTSGLKPGEQVVTKGSFVLKSQLLKSSLAEGE